MRGKGLEKLQLSRMSQAKQMSLRDLKNDMSGDPSQEYHEVHLNNWRKHNPNGLNMGKKSQLN